MSRRPSRRLMLNTEAHLRVLGAYVTILQTRLALARLTGTRRDFEGISDAALLQVIASCERATAAIAATLEGMSPELAATAAAVADLSCQREAELPCPPAARRLHVVTAGPEQIG